MDFILYGPQTFVALEVKNTTQIKLDHLSGLRSFSEDYPQSKLFFLYREPEIKKLKGTTCIPVENFLSGLEFYLK